MSANFSGQSATIFQFPARGRFVRVPFAGSLRGCAGYRCHRPTRRHEKRYVCLRLFAARFLGGERCGHEQRGRTGERGQEFGDVHKGRV